MRKGGEGERRNKIIQGIKPYLRGSLAMLGIMAS